VDERIIVAQHATERTSWLDDADTDMCAVGVERDRIDFVGFVGPYRYIGAPMSFVGVGGHDAFDDFE